MRAAKRLSDHRQAWVSPTVTRLKLTDEQVARIIGAASPEAELLKIYNARPKSSGPSKAAK